MPLVSSITNNPITKRADRLVNEILQNNWSISDPDTDNIGWAEPWETSNKNSCIFAWELPVKVELVGLAADHYDYNPISIQIDIMTRNPEMIPYPIALENMVFEIEKIITDNCMSGVQPEGYHSMILRGHEYRRGTNVSDKALAIVYVDLKVRMNHT